MLGINVPDAIALGTLILAVLAAVSGKKSGDAAKKADPITPSSSSTFADVELLAQSISLNTAAVTRLVAVMEAHATREQRDDEIEERVLLKELQKLLEKPKGR